MSLSLNEDITMETVMKNIYSSCDPDNSNLVPVIKIIDFITPYMLEDLSALESLKFALDPQNNNVCISSEQFYEMMNEWTKKISNSSDEDFNKTPSHLDVIDEKQLPYTQSTPRASFGQKLLSCEGLLNLSNVSSYSLSTSMQTKESNTVGADKTFLEEEIKRLEHHLNKLTNEMVMVKLQLTAAEEQNEILQADLDRCKTRLHSEQQIIEHLQNDKRYNDELQEELNLNKKRVEDLTKKLLQYEKDNHHLYGLVEQTEKENAKLENRCEELSRREQEAKKEIIDIKTELDLKDQEITTVIKVNDELKIKLNQQKDLIDQLTNENELLNHNKNSLEKALRDNLSARRDSIVSQYKTCLADSSSFPNLDQSSEEECYFKIQEADCKNFLCESLQAEISHVSLETEKMNYNILSLKKNEKQIGENNQNHNNTLEYYEKEINHLKIKNDSIQAKLDIVDKDNKQLCSQIVEMKNKIGILEQDINNLISEKKEKETILKKIHQEKSEIENEVKALKIKNLELKDENNNLIGNNKSINDILEAKKKILVDLDEKYLNLKKEFANLQIENISKEKELCEYRNKFNFETAFKNLQIELNEKNKEIFETKKSNEKLKKSLDEITNSNRELQESIKQTQLKLREHQEESRQMLILNENIEHTASQVQLHIDRKNSMISELVELNKKFECNINRLQHDLQLKIKEVTDLRDCLKSDMEIKNIMWRDNKKLELKLDIQYDTNKKLQDELHALKGKNKDIKEEHAILLSKYNEEMSSNCDLCGQILKQKDEMSAVLAKHDEEINKNQKLYEQICMFKTDLESIKINQEEYKEKINKKLCSYEELIINLETKLEELRVQNNYLKTELDTEKKKSLKEKFFNVDITPSEGTKNRSFEKQKLSIDRLKEKLEATEVLLQNEHMKSEKLRKIIKEKEDVEKKYTDIQLDFEKAQVQNLLEKQTLQNVINNLSDKVKNQEANYRGLENVLNEKEKVLTLKLSQLEQQIKHLFTELTNKDFLMNNALMENETYKNLLANADRKSQEFSSKISAYIFQINEKEEEINLLRAEVADKNNKTVSLMTTIAELEIQLSKSLDELADRTNVNISLEKENKALQEMLSKSDDHKEKELMDIEQKLKSTCRLLQCSEMELNLIQKKISDANIEFDNILREISNYKNIILSGQHELYRASSLTVKKWEINLGEEDAYQHMLNMNEHKLSEEDNGLLKLNDNVKLAVLLLDILADKAPKSMEDTEYSLNDLVNTDNSVSDGKFIKKFTLRAPRLIVSRPASPDSPCLDIDEANAANIQEVNYQDLLCNNEDSFKSTYEELSFNQDYFDLTSPETFPHISDVFLEKLGLHESSLKQILTDDETEKLFTTFAIQIALDSKDIKDRLQKQKELCTEQYEKFLSVIRDISYRLRDHKCIGAADPINPVFVLLEDLKFFLKDITQSVGQFGILTCENRMTRCWNLVTNYMAVLKQNAIRVESNEIIREENQSEGKKNNSCHYLRKRQQNLSPNKKNCEISAKSKHDTKTGLQIYDYVPSSRTTITVVTFLTFTVLILIALAHWQCRMTVPESQVCVLDDFIKNIQVGNPPY